MSDLVEARLAGAEGVGAVGDAVRLVSVAALGPVTPAVVQLGIWAQGEAMPGGESTEMFPRVRIYDQRFLKSTRLASDLVGAKVLAVVEEVAAQRGADASVVGALELVLLTGGGGGECRWGSKAKMPVSC